MLIDPGIRGHAHRPCDQYATLLYSASTDWVDGVVESREGFTLQPADYDLKKNQYKEIGKGLQEREDVIEIQIGGSVGVWHFHEFSGELTFRT